MTVFRALKMLGACERGLDAFKRFRSATAALEAADYADLCWLRAELTGRGCRCLQPLHYPTNQVESARRHRIAIRRTKFWRTHFGGGG